MKRKTIAFLTGVLLVGMAVGAKATSEKGTVQIQQVSAVVEGQADTTTGSDSSTGFTYSSVADVAEAAMPSIVAITNKSVQEVNSYFYRRSYQYESESAGSGIIVGSNDTELLICTNNHVVEDATELSVTFIDDETYSATLKGTDAANDLAVVAVNLSDISQSTQDQIKISLIGSSDDMRVGEQVVAIGNALGYGQSVTTGIISAKDRTINVSSDSAYENLIQTDAAINFGNSGGALLNMNGELIGINSAKASSSGVEGMGYAIPISKAMPILEDLMTRQTRVKLDSSEAGYIGITGQNVSQDATSFYGIPQGVYVTSVEENGPAASAGLKEGDIITAFDGETITAMQDLQNLLLYYQAGEVVEISISTQSESGGYEESSISVTLGDRSAAQ